MDMSYIGLDEARDSVRGNCAPLACVKTPVSKAAGMTAAKQVTALVNSPSVTGSTKDGFAVCSVDLKRAGPESHVKLDIVGSIAAGEAPCCSINPGSAAKITTGAPLPPGADAVLASEFAEVRGDHVFCLADANPGRNVMPKGGDVAVGDILARQGDRLTPARLGLMAAGGRAEIDVHPNPVVGLLATGREVVAPGRPLPKGSVYASNLVALSCWLTMHGIGHKSQVVDDNGSEIRRAAESLLQNCDALLTSGGAWTSGRDLVVGALMEMGMDLKFRRVRIGPGKGVAFGLLGEKPVFCLPGGPPSNEMSFLQLALPGLLRLAGHKDPGLPLMQVRLAKPLTGQEDWTQFWHGRLRRSGQGPAVFEPFGFSGRLAAMAGSDAIASLAEGRSRLEEGETIMVQRLDLAFSQC